MAGGTTFFVLLVFLVKFTVVKAVCETALLGDPDPTDDTVTVSVDIDAFITQITLKEERPDVKLAVFNCEETDVPTIVKFHTGNPLDLGLELQPIGDQWFLVAKEAQDYETPSRRFYRFSVTAAGRIAEDVVINVVNEDDSTPYFDFSGSSTCEIPETHNGPTTCQLLVYDMDGLMDGITFSVKEQGVVSEEIELVEAESQTCRSTEGICIDVVLRIKKLLSYDKPVHALTLEVTDKAGHSGSISYFVQVIAEDKEKPVIEPDELWIEIDEEYSGVIDFNGKTITVSDGDSLSFGQFVITLEGDGTSDCYTAFDVIPRAGYRTADLKLSIIDPGLLDYDKGTCNDITIKIIATEDFDKTNVGETQIHIKLKDVNDEPPKFDEDDFVFSALEHEEIGTILGNVKATDLDTFDTNLIYSLTSETHLSIDPATGSISVNADFNYERQPEIIVSVKAADNNTPPHIAYAQVIVNIIDINDEKPELNMPSNPTEVEENTPAGEDLNVKISATDQDTNSELKFGINWETSRAAKQGVAVDKSTFEKCITIETQKDPNKIGSAEAVLKTGTKELNWELFDTLYLTIEVEDTKTDVSYLHNKISSATLTITIIDLNDNDPEILPYDSLKFREESDEGQLVGIITARDKDGDGHNNITYELENYLLYEEEYVTINNVSGEIRTGRDKIDYEIFSSIKYNVIASDGSRSSTESVTIEIQDINDNTPYFVGDYSAPLKVDENMNEYVKLVDVVAKDDDASSDFNIPKYELSDDENSGIFEINRDTGELYLPQGKGSKLDYETKSTYTIEVIAKDHCPTAGNCYGDSLTSRSLRITIELNNLNDGTPFFRNGDEDLVTLSEEAGLAVIGYVIAEDSDLGDFGRLTYSIESADPVEGLQLFDIETEVETNRGAIKLVTSLINERRPYYLLTVKAQDVGSQSDTATFKVTVTDVNNNSPVFEFPTHAEIRLNMAGNLLDKVLVNVSGGDMTFRAIDEYDDGPNGNDTMSYAVIGDGIATEYLVMWSNELRLKKDFDDNMKREFVLTVEACDGEIRKQCTQQETPIRVTINTPYEPTFADSEWGTSFTENATGLNEKKKINVIVTDLNDEDDDYEGCEVCKDPIYYFIIGGNDENKFVLENEYIKLNQELDREVKDVYDLIVAVTNNEKGPNIPVGEKSKLNILINVTDVTDTPPAFTKSLFAAGINTGDNIGGEVTTFTADEEDLNDELSYTIIDETLEVTHDSLKYLLNKNPFIIKENTLVLNFDVPSGSVEGIFKFDVEVSDLGHNKDKVACQIYIISENNHVTMTFFNNATYVESKKLQMADIFTKVFKWQGNVRKVVKSVNSEGLPIDDKADVTAYFVDENKQQPIDKANINSAITDKETYKALKDALIEEKLILDTIEDPTAQGGGDMEGVLQTVLIVVSVVLGTLVVILFAAFFFRTRSLNRRLEALSTTKFGSQDSGLNRVGISVPNTNRHAVEGSNPVWGNEDVANRDFDNVSQSSGDSDLIGIEENPEFNQYAKNGASNDGFTPDIESGRQASVNPMVAPGFDRRVSLNPLSAAALQDAAPVDVSRRASVNPMAGTYNGNDSDYENDSRRSSETMEQNSNFSFMQNTDTTPSTEL